MIATHPNPDAEAQRIRDDFERYEDLIHIAVRRGVVTQDRANRLLLDRALTDSCRIVAMGVRP